MFNDVIEACIARNVWLRAHLGGLAQAVALRNANWTRRPKAKEPSPAATEYLPPMATERRAPSVLPLPSPAAQEASILEALERELNEGEQE